MEGAQGVSGPSSSCVWNPRVFADDARGWQCPFVLCLHPQGCIKTLLGQLWKTGMGYEDEVVVLYQDKFPEFDTHLEYVIRAVRGKELTTVGAF